MAFKNTQQTFINTSIRNHPKHNYDYSLVKFIDMDTPVKIECPVHGEFEQAPHHHLSGHGCARCADENNLKEIKLFNKISGVYPNIDHQYYPDWLGTTWSGPNQSLDMYLPEYGIAIEYQGRQHFHSVEYFGGKKAFIRLQKSDENKRKLCLENDCKLFYFTYTPSDVPPDYPHKVYTCEDKLITAIRQQIKDLP